MHADVAVSPDLGTEDQEEIGRLFRRLGVIPNVAVTPTLRGGDLSWLVLASLPLVAFLNTLGTKIAEEGYAGLRDLVRRISRHAGGKNGSVSPLLLRDETTGTVIELVDDLPDEGYRALLALDLSESAGGRLRYDPEERRWRAVVERVDHSGR